MTQPPSPTNVCDHDDPRGEHCLLCRNRVCPNCAIYLPNQQGLCQDCNRQLMALGSPPSAQSVLPRQERLLDPHRAPMTFGFCGLLVLLYLASCFPNWAAPNDHFLNQVSLDPEALFSGHEYWRLLTANLFHASLAHIGVNTLALLIFGSLVEPQIGSRLVLAWMVIAMLSCDVVSLLLLPGASIGASGIAYGLQIAFLTLTAKQVIAENQQPLLRALWDLRGYVLIILLIFWNESFDGQVINVYGHLGGALGGFLCSITLPVNRPWQPSDNFKLSLIAVGVTLTLFLLLLFG